MTEIAREYAEALFTLAREEQCERAISDGLKLASQSFAENPEYVDFLASPGIPVAQRTAALGAVFDDKMPEYALSFMQLLCEKGHIRSFDDCVEEYERLYSASVALANARVISAIELSDDEKNAIVMKLSEISGKRVMASFEVDEGLLGGVTVHMDGNVLDGSLKHRMSELTDIMKG